MREMTITSIPQRHGLIPWYYPGQQTCKWHLELYHDDHQGGVDQFKTIEH